MTNEKSSEATTEDIYRKLLRLYERLTAETVTIGKQGEIMGKIIEELQAESKLATDFKVQVRRDLLKHVNQAVADIDDRISQAMTAYISKEVAKAVNDFTCATSDGARILEKYTDDAAKRKIWTRIGVGCLGVICCCVLYITVILIKRIPKDLTIYQVETYQQGKLFQALLDRVSNRERVELMKLARGELPAQSGSIEWIKKHNPKLSDFDARVKFIDNRLRALENQTYH